MTALLSRTSLRVKLVVTVVVLAGGGLAISGIAAISALHGYLLDRVDQQLQSFAEQPVRKRQSGHAV